MARFLPAGRAFFRTDPVNICDRALVTHVTALTLAATSCSNARAACGLDGNAQLARAAAGFANKCESVVQVAGSETPCGEFALFCARKMAGIRRSGSQQTLHSSAYRRKAKCGRDVAGGAQSLSALQAQ